MERLKYLAEQEKLTSQRNIAMCIAFLFMGSVVVILLCKKIRQKSKIANRIRAEKDIIANQHEELIDIVAKDNALRAENSRSITEITMMLQDISQDRNKTLTEDMWEDVFNSVDKACPDFRNHVLAIYQYQL